MSVNWKIMDQTTPTKIHVSWSKLLGAPVARYEQDFCRKFTKFKFRVEAVATHNILEMCHKKSEQLWSE